MSEHLAIIFDVDGVLVDSYQAHYDSWQLLCRRRGRRMSRRQFVNTFGRTSRETIAAVWPEMRDSPEDIDRLDADKEAVFREILARDFPAMPGAIALIDTLHEARFSLAVGSSGPPENVELILEKLGRRDLFRGVVTGRDVTVGKPDPQVFSIAADRLDVPPNRCTVIEDAPAGVAAAGAGGMKCVGLVSTGHTRDELASADLVVESLSELSVDILGQLCSA